GTWTAFDAPIAALEAARADPGLDRARGDGEALIGQLRSAWRAATTPAETVETGRPGARAPRMLRPSAIRESITTLRANLSLGSGFARHGIRLAAVLGVATFAAHALPLHRAYWIALTAALVLRNDFQSTFTRGTARILGTLAGAVVASSVAALVRPYPATLLVLAVAFAFFAYVVFNVNYALFTVAITGYVIFLLALGGLPEHVALADRVDETLIGGALALCAYALWPTWERALVPERLADLLEKQRRYAALVLQAYVDPATADEAAIRSAQTASWLARSSAETSVDRMLAEPVRPRALTVRAALGVLAASRRFGIAALGLHARLSRARPVATSRLRTLATEIDDSFEILEDALRRHADPAPLPDLRDAQIALVKRMGETHRNDATSLDADTDLMVDSINTIAHVLHRLRTAGDGNGSAPPDA
ncbi:MAG: FUSC family protein, partial [Candidatus Eremiobacteraeota bacterium]|nr:FUSC family protein [Candidatus Eremiobacteraeota bacterium]